MLEWQLTGNFSRKKGKCCDTLTIGQISEINEFWGKTRKRRINFTQANVHPLSACQHVWETGNSPLTWSFYHIMGFLKKIAKIETGITKQFIQSLIKCGQTARPSNQSEESFIPRSPLAMVSLSALYHTVQNLSRQKCYSMSFKIGWFGCSLSN